MLCSVVLQDKEDSGQARSLPTADLGPVVLGRVMQCRTAPVWSAHKGLDAYHPVRVSICVSLNKNKTWLLCFSQVIMLPAAF